MKLNQTMYDLIQHEQSLFAHCYGCEHGQIIEPNNLIFPLIWNMNDLAKHLSCSQCKSNNIQVVPAQSEIRI